MINIKPAKIQSNIIDSLKSIEEKLHHAWITKNDKGNTSQLIIICLTKNNYNQHPAVISTQKNITDDLIQLPYKFRIQ